MDAGSATSLHYTFDVQGGDFAKAGDASSKVKRILQQIGAGPEIVGASRSPATKPR